MGGWQPPAIGGLEIVERRILECGQEQEEDLAVRGFLRARCNEVTELEQARQQLFGYGLELHGRQAELNAFKEQLRGEYDSARLCLGAERSACESEIQSARVAATTTIQQELQKSSFEYSQLQLLEARFETIAKQETSNLAVARDQHEQRAQAQDVQLNASRTVLKNQSAQLEQAHIAQSQEMARLRIEVSSEQSQKFDLQRKSQQHADMVTMVDKLRLQLSEHEEVATMRARYPSTVSAPAAILPCFTCPNYINTITTTEYQVQQLQTYAHDEASQIESLRWRIVQTEERCREEEHSQDEVVRRARVNFHAARCLAEDEQQDYQVLKQSLQEESMNLRAEKGRLEIAAKELVELGRSAEPVEEQYDPWNYQWPPAVDSGLGGVEFPPGFASFPASSSAPPHGVGSLLYPVMAGDKVLHVSNDHEFIVGDLIKLTFGQYCEVHRVEGKGSLHLDSPINVAFPAGAEVVRIPAPAAPAAASVPPAAPVADTAAVGMMQQLMEHLVEAQRSNAEEQRCMIQSLTHAQRESTSKLRPPKPVLTAADAPTLKTQLEKFVIYQNESRQSSKSVWLEGARAIAEGIAKVELEDLIVTEIGGEAEFQRLIKVPTDPRWETWWTVYKVRLKVAVNLDDSHEANEAVRRYSRLTLVKGANLEVVAKFLNDYTAVRTDMHRHGLLTDEIGSPILMREIEEYKTKIEGSDMFTYLLDLPVFPSKMAFRDGDDPCTSILARCRQYVRARQRPGLDASATRPAHLLNVQATPKKTAAEKKMARESKEQDKVSKAKEILKMFTSAAPAPPVVAGDAASSDAQQLDTRWRGAREPGKGGKGGGKEQKAGTGNCTRCKGTHPECTLCPNQKAGEEAGWDVSKAVQDQLPCWYNHLGRGNMCGGFGHISRHHAACYTPEAQKAADEHRKKREEQSKGKGKSKKGKSGGGVGRLLTMNATHDTDMEERADKAARLLASLFVVNDGEETTTRGVSLDDPVVNDTLLAWKRARQPLPSRVSRALMKVRHFVGRCLVVISCVILLLVFGGLFAVGLEGMVQNSENPMVTTAVNHEFVRRFSRLGRDADMFVLSISGGYNCRGFTWIGQARTETVFDTGATRNSIDGAFLRALLEEERTRDQVVNVEKIEPIVCRALKKSHTMTVDRLATLRVTFRENGLEVSETLDIGFLVIKDSSEDLLIGKPTLDRLGFVSDKESIELRSLGIRFPTVLPGEQDDTKTHTFLKCSDHLLLEPQEGRSHVQILSMIAPKQAEKEELWLEPGPDIPDMLQVVEGPLVVRDGRFNVHVVVHGPAQIGPGTRLLRARGATERDRQILDAVGQEESRRDAEVYLLRQAQEEGRPPDSTPEKQADESFLKTSYKTRGKKERQEIMFPELVKEIAEEKAARKATTKFPDQSSEEFKNEAERVATGLLGPQLSPRQRRSFLTKVIRAFSMSFWIPGCNPPRVAGFVADIRTAPDHVPRVTQPFPLSKFDDLRIRFHEDCEVEDGKARWLRPGEWSEWGSPSFVVDSDSKGLLGRPVRDYRYPNSCTLEEAWPSANADACLRRAQEGAVHTQLDCIWGFTQLELSEASQRVFTLITKRGMLRPLVLFFGAKQGPSIFQKLMDSTFGEVVDKKGEQFSSIFMDDVTISTNAYESDSDDDVIDRHVEHCGLFLEAGQKRRIQFKLSKSKFCYEYIHLLGFKLGRGERFVDPGKADRLLSWPAPTSIDDLVSFRAYCNFIREFIPNFTQLDAPLKPYMKKGAKFHEYLKDLEAQAAFERLKHSVAREVGLATLDYAKAADPESGCPIELYVDASDIAWGATLAQRREKDGPLRPVAVVGRGFSATEQGWSTFERELCGLREALMATYTLTKGFVIIVYTDHRNNLFTDALFANKRISKKLLRWTLDLEELGSRVVRVWLRGEDNILGDAPSRHPADRDVLKNMKVPGGPIRRVVEQMFTKPDDPHEVQQMTRFLEEIEGADVASTSRKMTEGKLAPVKSKNSYQVHPPPVEATPTPPVKATAVKVKTATRTPVESSKDDEDALSGPPLSSQEQIGTDGTDLDYSDSDPGDCCHQSSLESFTEGNDEDTAELYRLVAGLVDYEREEHCSKPVFIDTHQWDGKYPRHPLCAFLPVNGSDPAVDPRAPRNPRVLPYRVSHVKDERGENFVVEYRQAQVGHDGIARKKIFYRCKPNSVEDGSVEAVEGHQRAERLAWAHVEAVLAQHGEAAEVESSTGAGPLSGTGFFRRHGDPHEGYEFHVHPRRPDFLTRGIWRPIRDTLQAAQDFCVSHEYVRRLGDGTEVFRCRGHEVLGSGVEVLPELLRGRPLVDKRLCEVFSGAVGPHEGGANLSRVWEAAGGTAEQFDVRINPDMDIRKADAWLEGQKANPCDVYHFALPSTSFLDPRRTSDFPYGPESDAEVAQANDLAGRVLAMALTFLELGSVVMIENPLSSRLFDCGGISALLGFDGFEMIRTDHCQDGAPYFRSQVFAGNTSALVDTGRVCNHQQHAQSMGDGVHSRRAAPYPRAVCERIVGGFVSSLQATGVLGTSVQEQASQAMTVDGLVSQSESDEGQRRIAQLRHGAARATPPPPPAPPVVPVDEGAGRRQLRVQIDKAKSFHLPAESEVPRASLLRRRTVDARTGEILEDLDVDVDTTDSYLKRPLDRKRDLVVDVWYRDGDDVGPPLADQEVVRKPFDTLEDVHVGILPRSSGLRLLGCSKPTRTFRTSSALMYYYVDILMLASPLATRNFIVPSSSN